MHHSPTKQTPDLLVQRASDVTYAHDLSGNLTFLNEEGERITGYSCKEACGMNIAELLGPEIAAQVREEIFRDAKERVGTVYEIDIITKDGRRVPLEASMRVVLRDGKPVEIQGIAVPSVFRNPSLSFPRFRCLDEKFFFGTLSLEQVGEKTLASN